MRGDVLDHVGLLPEGPAANLAGERLLPSVNLQMLLEVEPLAVDQEATDRTAFVIRPVVVHVLVEALQVPERDFALDAVQRPVVVLDVVLVVGDLRGRAGGRVLHLLPVTAVGHVSLGTGRALVAGLVAARLGRGVIAAPLDLLGHGCVQLLDLLHLLDHLQLVQRLRGQNVHLLLPDARERKREGKVSTEGRRVKSRPSRTHGRLNVLRVVVLWGGEGRRVDSERGRRRRRGVLLLAFVVVGSRLPLSETEGLETEAELVRLNWAKATCLLSGESGK